jgi:hypothetical protein
MVQFDCHNIGRTYIASSADSTPDTLLCGTSSSSVKIKQQTDDSSRVPHCTAGDWLSDEAVDAGVRSMMHVSDP